MRVLLPDVQDTELRQSIEVLQIVLEKISSDNMQIKELTGTTDGSADTQRLFKHGLTFRPKLWFFLEGDVYVPRHGVDENNIDIRSAKTSEDFRVLLVL